MNTWILIADAGNARLFELEHGEKLKLLRTFENPKGRAHAQDLVSSEPGRIEKGRGRMVLSAMEPKTTPHEVEMDRFALELAHALRDAVEHKKLKSLSLVAPPHFLGLLRQRLDPAVAKLVLVALDKDYAHLSEHELNSHLAPVLGEIEKGERVVQIR